MCAPSTPAGPPKKGPPPVLLALLFLFTACLYAAAGFGGGSTYTALLALWGVELAAVPVVSLACNILVVAVGSWRFARAGHVALRRVWPLFAASVPAAFIGGALPVPRLVFIGLLALSLLVAGLVMLWRPRQAEEPARSFPAWLEPLVGAVLGLLAGIVGIGGGIYLAPVLHLLRWGSAHAIAGACALFILVNSLAGLAGQLVKSGPAMMAILSGHLLLLPAVLLGGAAGSLFTTRRLPAYPLRLLTALLILFVAAQLGIRFVGGLTGSGS
jgi:uncharacterized protein